MFITRLVIVPAMLENIRLGSKATVKGKNRLAYNSKTLVMVV
jgi:hypothetical protein